MRSAAFSPRTQHTDPPLLWISVVTGSLFLNAVFTLGFRNYLEQAKPSPPTFSAIAVDFMSVGAPPSSKIARPVPSNRPAPGAIANPPTVAPVAPSVSTNPATRLAPNPPQPTRRPAQSPALSTASATRQPATVPPAPEPSSAVEPPPPASTTSTTPPTPASPAPPDQVATSGIRLPDFTAPPDPTQNPGTATSSATPEVPLKPATPAKFLMQVQVLDPGGDPDTAIVTLKSEPFTKTLTSGESGCILTPEIMQNFNQPLQFALTLNSQGKVLQAVPLDSSPNQSYENLAICALQTWSFDPAGVLASTTSASPSRPFKVKVTLSQL